MHALSILSLVALAAVPAVADFRIYYGSFHGYDGEQFGQLTFFQDADPDCNDVTSNPTGGLVAAPDSDASAFDGYVCDGCSDFDTAVADFNITRLEMHGGDKYHYTIYQSNGAYNMVDLDNNQVATCTRTSADDYNCEDSALGFNTAEEIFSCASSLQQTDF